MKRNIIAILIANGLMAILYFAFPNFWDHSLTISGPNDHVYENVIEKALHSYLAYVAEDKYIPGQHQEVLAELQGLHKVPNLSDEQNNKLDNAIQKLKSLEKVHQDKLERKLQQELNEKKEKMRKEEEDRARQQAEKEERKNTERREREEADRQARAREQAQKNKQTRQDKVREQQEREREVREKEERKRIEQQAKDRENKERGKIERQTNEEGKTSAPSDSLKSNKNTSASMKPDPGTVKQQTATKSTQPTSKTTLVLAEYKVSRGETLYSIAQKFNTTVEKIVNDNPKRESNEDVKKGEIILIKMAKDTAEVRKTKVFTH